MDHIILCEGSTDYVLLQYYMRKVNNWEDKKEEQKDVFRIEKYSSRRFVKNKDSLTIASTNGNSGLCKGLSEVLQRNILAAPTETVFDSIVIVTDRDEVGTEDEFMEQVKQTLQSVSVSLESDYTANAWIKCSLHNRIGLKKEFRILVMVIPFEGTGALETFLLQAVADENAYDGQIIGKCNEFVDQIDPERRYLNHRRYITKAKFDTYFSIRTPAAQFNERQNILKAVPWEKYTKIQKDFLLLEQM